MGRYEDRPLNPHIALHGRAGRLRAPFDHIDMHSVADWVAKHNKYTDVEADEYLQETYGKGYESSIPARFWGDQPERKRWIKLRVWNRFPLLLRPFLFFFRNYFVKLGFLDGKPGFIYHVLWSFWVRFLIDTKIIERQMRQGTARLSEGVLTTETPCPPGSPSCELERKGIHAGAGG